MSQRLKEAMRRERQARDEVEAALKADYPPGSDLQWKRGGGRVQSGSVVRNFYGDRLRVHNENTGRELDIHAFDIVQAMEASSG